MSDSVFLEIGQSIYSENTGIYYRNIKHLGTGGNAVTFHCLATNGQFQGNLFAIKIFRRRSLEEQRESFLREVDFLQSNNHQSIMRVFDKGIFYGNPFVVAEYCPDTLAKIISNNSSSLFDKLTYSLSLLSAIKFLSELQPQIVHRDIKPENIFIKGGSCILGDFGLMKVLDGNLDLDREVFKESTGVGMPYRYRTPDLVNYAKQKAPLTTKSDIFQLGLVIAELFTGRNPSKQLFYGDDIYSPVEIESINIPIYGDLGKRIYGQILAMLKDDPNKRPSAAQLLNYWQKIFDDALTSGQLI